VALVEVAKSLGSGLRDCDLLCRYGGEEFIVMLPETKAGKALKVAERMRKNISLIAIPQILKGITISAGLAELLSDESDEQFLVRCDRALYRAKESGRNRCCMDTP
jgi:diguanylate cyclase (GGDEF)-like protein